MFQVPEDFKGDLIDLMSTVRGPLITLTSALEIANLQDTLKKDGPFTIFAPNNLAFAKVACVLISFVRQI